MFEGGRLSNQSPTFFLKRGNAETQKARRRKQEHKKGASGFVVNFVQSRGERDVAIMRNSQQAQGVALDNAPQLLSRNRRQAGSMYEVIEAVERFDAQ